MGVCVHIQIQHPNPYCTTFDWFFLKLFFDNTSAAVIVIKQDGQIIGMVNRKEFERRNM